MRDALCIVGLALLVGCGGGSSSQVDGGTADAMTIRDAGDATAGQDAADATGGHDASDAGVVADAAVVDDATGGDDALTTPDAPEGICPADMLGAGTEATPCLITSCVQLQAMREDLSFWYRLANDIDCSDTVNWNSGAGFEPVGQHPSPFTGGLYGAGRVVTGLAIHRADEEDVGLFALTASPFTIADVGLESVDVAGGHHVGSLVGRQQGGTITGCSATGSATGGEYGLVGGLVGWLEHGTITGSAAAVTVSSGFMAGGLVGLQGEGGGLATDITSSNASGSVTGDIEVGGLVGAGGPDSTITDSAATGSVTGRLDVAGLAGGHSGTITRSYALGNVTGSDAGGSYLGGLVGSGRVTITDCYAAGDVQGWAYVGGLVAHQISGTITNSYAAGSVTGDSVVAGLVATQESDPSTSSLILNCFAAGRVTGNDPATRGGLIGSRLSGTITNSYWYDDAGGNADDCYMDYAPAVPGNDGCTKISSATGVSYFYVTSPTANPPMDSWDFATTPVWSTICNGSAFPPLARQGLASCP